MSIKCVVLDIDDTLYLERDYVRSGFEAVGSHFKTILGIDGFADHAYRLFEEGRRGDTFNQVARELAGLEDDALIAQCVRIYREHNPVISLLQDADLFLTSIPEKYRTAVITDGPAPSQHAKAHALGLYERTEMVIITSEHGPSWSKPSRLAFQAVEREFDLHDRDLVYIADNPLKDFQAPLELGWHTIRVRRPNSLHARLDTADPRTLEVSKLALHTLTSLEG